MQDQYKYMDMDMDMDKVKGKGKDKKMDMGKDMSMVMDVKYSIFANLGGQVQSAEVFDGHHVYGCVYSVPDLVLSNPLRVVCASFSTHRGQQVQIAKVNLKYK